MKEDSLLGLFDLLLQLVDLVVKILVLVTIVRLSQLFSQLLDESLIFFDLLGECVNSLLYLFKSLLLLLNDLLIVSLFRRDKEDY